MFNKTLAILAVSVFSGIMSGIYFLSDGYMQWGIYYGPGIFFGVATAGLFIWLYRMHFIKAALWAGASILSWFIAVLIYTYLPQGTGGPEGLVVAGVCGAALLSLSHYALVREMSWQRIIVVLAVGGILAAIMYMLIHVQDSATTLRYIVSFVIWQVGVALALDAESTSKA